MKSLNVETVTQLKTKSRKELKARAAGQCVSMEEHRAILPKALSRNDKGPSFKDYLRSMPDVGPDGLFERIKP